MGRRQNQISDLDSDDAAIGLSATDRSLLGTIPGTDRTRRIAVDDNGSISATVVNSTINVLANGSVTSVPLSTLSTIVTYTATVPTYISRLSMSGSIYAKFQIFKNMSLIETVRTGPSRNAELEFRPGFDLSTSDILDIKVVHYQVGLLEDFEATIYGA